MVGGAERRPARWCGKRPLLGCVLDEAILAGAHMARALIGPAGDLLGIGSLQLGHKGPNEHLDVDDPIDDLKPIFDDLMKFGRRTGRRAPGSASMRPRSRTRIVVVELAADTHAQAANPHRQPAWCAAARWRVATAFRKSIGHFGNAGVKVRYWRDGARLKVTHRATARGS